MLAQDYLDKVKKSSERLHAKEIEIERIDSMVNSVTQHLTPSESCPVPKSSNRRTDNLARYIDAKDNLKKALVDTLALRAEAMALLDKLENSNHYDVLYARYLDGKEWKDIAEDMAYTYHHVHKIHSDALIKFQDILDEVM